MEHGLWCERNCADSAACKFYESDIQSAAKDAPIPRVAPQLFGPTVAQLWIGSGAVDLQAASEDTLGMTDGDDQREGVGLGLRAPSSSLNNWWSIVPTSLHIIPSSLHRSIALI